MASRVALDLPSLLPRCPPPPPCCHAPSPCCRCHRQHPRPRHNQSTPLPSPSPSPSPPPPPAATVAIAASPYHLSPLSLLPPPRPHPCLRRHYRCSLCRCHCVSNAPVDGWLWCSLLPLTYCVVRRPNLSAPAIVRSLTLSPPGRRPLLLTIASHCPVALLLSINRFWLPLMVGCCILRPPSSIPTTSPS